MAEQWEDMTRGSTITVASSSALHPQQAHYRCDGLADEQEIHQADNDVPTTGGKIRLTEGRFYPSTTINISSNVVLCGMGEDITTIVGTGIGSHYNIIANSDPSGGNTNIHIRDLTVDAGWTSGGTGVYGGAINFVKCTDSTITDVNVHNGYQHDVMVSRSQRIHLTRLDCYAAQGDDCITVSDGSGVSESEYIWIVECYVHDSGTAAYQSGIEVDDGPQYVYIIGCVGENISGRDFNGHIHAGEKAIKHIYFRNCTGTGLIVYNSSATEVYDDIEVSGCTLNECSLVGPGKHVHVTDNPSLGWVYISDISEDIRVCDNTISNPGDEYGGIGIHCVNVDINGVLLQGNTISTTAQAGIFIEARAGRTITYLNILDNVGYPVNWQTIAMQGPGTVDQVRISGNDCFGSGGIYVNPNVPYQLTMTNWIIEDNPGVCRKASGSATVLAANTSVTVVHGIDRLGSANENGKFAQATPRGDWGNTVNWWISAFNSVNLIITVDVAPGGAGLGFYWEADATRGTVWAH